MCALGREKCTKKALLLDNKRIYIFTKKFLVKVTEYIIQLENHLNLSHMKRSVPKA